MVIIIFNEEDWTNNLSNIKKFVKKDGSEYWMWKKYSTI